MSLELLFDSESRGHVFDLFLADSFRLGMEKVIELQLEVFSPGLVLPVSDVILLQKFVLGLRYERQIGIRIEVNVVLQKDSVFTPFGLFLVEFLYGLQILLLKVFFLELDQDEVTFF